MFLSPADSGAPRRVYYSASDLKAAVECEWGMLRKLDSKLGRVEAVEDPEDLMLERAARLGDAHELRELERYRAQFGAPREGAGVVEIDRPDPSNDPVALAHARDLTVAALRSGADVVFQGTFFDEPDDGGPGFVGFADFLIRSTHRPELTTGQAASTTAPGTTAHAADAPTSDTAHEPLPADALVYDVYDTKLARSAKITALLQLAAYADQLQRLGIPVGDRVYLILGNGETSEHRLDDILPVFRDRVARLIASIQARVDDPDDAPLPWGAEGVTACGRCEWCTPEVERTRDVLLVAGMRTSQRARLAEVGIHTIDQLAELPDAATVDGIGPQALRTLRAQAQMQLAAPPVTTDATGAEHHEVAWRVHDAMGLAALPEPDAGDIFFDFEGDPLWTDDYKNWGLEYLFGVIDHDDPAAPGARTSENFRPFWAHDRPEEGRALVAFLEYVRDRRRRHPGMHIYHYADYERSHLQQLCARHGTGEAILDELLREHVFVDLYPVVKRSIRISENSYSLKKLEPLYMGDELRESSVTTGADSVQAYVDYTVLRDAGRDAEAAALLAEIGDYNRYDCVSTLRLRDWLLARADENGVARRPEVVADEPRDADLERAEDEIRARLSAPIDGIPAADRSPDETTLALAGAAIEYHRREDKTYWWEHFNRQVDDIENWRDTRDVLVVEEAATVREWETPKRATTRTVKLHGRLAPASRLGVGDTPFVMYDHPLPSIITGVPAGQRGEHARAEVLEIDVDGEHATVLLDESAGIGGETWDAFPVALTPSAPIPTKAQRQAILAWGGALAETLSDGGRGLPDPWPKSASLDLLRRLPPRFATGVLEPVGIDGVPAAIADSLQRLDRSYVAVQGPPGSGKTYVGAKVIAHLVTELKWRIGVVAQSHEVVENVLRRVIESEGVPADRVAKRPPSRGYDIPPPWTVLKDNGALTDYVQTEWDAGFVLGGTAWDFANGGKVPRDGLDLLVIDEAGQFSLANTIAVGVSAQRMLLLGDPQQLPQVSQGLHPEPVDTSALGWLSDGHDVLPPELGYFLAESWRMHPALCAAVSDLSYEGRLASAPSTLSRNLDGVEPGLHPVPVVTAGYSTENPVEVDEVVRLVAHHVGMPWTDPTAASPRTGEPLRPSDVIVVAPYNAQVDLLRHALDAAGFRDTPVGTVDKFQGQEAAIAIVSLTASSADDVPRGIDFLLTRNRINVAISRAQWAAYLVHSPALRDHLPHRPAGLAQLSAFIRLTSRD